jgi:ribosomal protein L11 methyltransferase
MLELSIKANILNIELEEELIAKLYNIGFDSFWIENDAIKAYIEENNFNIQSLKCVIKSISVPVQYFVKEMEQKNWNEQWEKSFEPIIIDEKLLIKAPFHTNTLKYPLEITIQPQMSFGTGHHPTTQLIASYLLKKNIENKVVADAGCGTGVLSVLVEKLGAKKIIAFDIEENAVNSAKENIKNNNCFKIEVFKGTIRSVLLENVDIIIANINRNVLLEEMPLYFSKIMDGGELIISGFIQKDVQIILDRANECSLTLKETLYLNDWYGLVLTK